MNDHQLGQAIEAILCLRLGPAGAAIGIALLCRARSADANPGPAHCVTSMPALADDIGISVATARKGLRKLRDLGLISWEQGGYSHEAGRNLPNVYNINIDAIMAMRNPVH